MPVLLKIEPEGVPWPPSHRPSPWGRLAMRICIRTILVAPAALYPCRGRFQTRPHVQRAVMPYFAAMKSSNPVFCLPGENAGSFPRVGVDSGEGRM